MATTTITIQVEPEAAKAFAAASRGEQRKMQLLLESPVTRPHHATREAAASSHRRDRHMRGSAWSHPRDLGVAVA